MKGIPLIYSHSLSFVSAAALLILSSAACFAADNDIKILSHRETHSFEQMIEELDLEVPKTA